MMLHLGARVGPLLATLASSSTLRSSVGPVAVIDTAARNEEAVRTFFYCWNQRDMHAAAALFSEDVVYEDTLYPERFVGKEQLCYHLNRVADAVPASFRFKVDMLSGSAESVGAQWHVELADGTQLPFTRGCSMYKFNEAGQITSGFDVPEPTLKSGSVSLALLSLVSKLFKAFDVGGGS
uniref:SnoaL-like domain-containing protein n=1 Tax=Coccolithus braarudii TaxID=221442 RepID=A0A7S0Q831_9EUKA